MEAKTTNISAKIRQVQKHLYDNRKAFTEEQFFELIELLSKEVYEYAYGSGWNARNHLDRLCSTQRRIRMRADYDELYNRHIDAVGNVDGTKPIMLKQFELIEDTFRDWM